MGGHLLPTGWSEGNVGSFEREWVLGEGFAPAARHFDKAFQGSALIEGVFSLVGQNPFLNTFDRNGPQPGLFVARIQFANSPLRRRTRPCQRYLLLAKSTIPILVRPASHSRRRGGE